MGPPWSVEDIGAAVLKDSSGQKLAYAYYEEQAGRRSCEDAHEGWRRIAANVAEAAGAFAERVGVAICLRPDYADAGLRAFSTPQLLPLAFPHRLAEANAQPIRDMRLHTVCI